MFSLGLDLKFSNLPLKGVFIPLINRLISEGDILRYKDCGTYADFSDYKVSAVLTTPSNKRFQINPEINKNYRYLYEETGFYTITDKKIKKHISLNINKDEFNLNYLDNKGIYQLNDNVSVIDNTDDIIDILNKQKNSMSLWRYFLISIIFLLIIEMYLSNFYIKNE